MNRLPGIYARGLAMGAADVVPGVSGGTLALITGIYQELIDTLGGIDPRLLGVWRRQGFLAFWRAGNFGFLASLLAGILTSIVLFANLIGWLMEHYPVPLWSFFAGLILASVPVVLQPVVQGEAGRSAGSLGPVFWLCLAAGFGIAWWIGTLPGMSTGLDIAPWQFFLAGAVAICAMILPGISGSFILVLLGMYAPVLAAVRAFDLPIILTFGLGCGLGLLSFVHLLKWLLHRYHDPMMGMLAGFMAGSMNKLWPWRVTEGQSLVPINLSPAEYLARTGLPPMVVEAVVAALVGVGLVLGLAWLGAREARPARA